MKQAIQPFATIYENRFQYLSDLKKDGHKILGYMCVHVPEEIIYAAGLHPVRMSSVKGQMPNADQYLQGYVCGFARSCLEAGLVGQYDFLEGVVFPHTCDTIRQLHGIWKRNITGKYQHFLSLPMETGTELALELTSAELEEFKTSIERSFAVRITEERLWEAIKLFNKIRSLLKELSEYVFKGSLTAKEFWYVTNAGFVIPRDQYLTMINKLFMEIKEQPSASVKGVRLHLSGSTIETPVLLDIIEEEGGWVVSDDLCTGSRYFDKQVDVDKESLIDSLSRLYLEKTICPCKFPFTRRLEQVKGVVKNSGAKGVIMGVQKFCDPHLFDYPKLKQNLEQQGISVQMIEIEHDLGATETIRTRIKSMVEMLEGVVV